MSSESLQGVSPEGLPASAPSAQQRTLPRRRSRYFRGRATPVGAMPIPNSNTDSGEGSPNDPLERWRRSPPHTEGASMTDIARALRNTPLQTRRSTRSISTRSVARSRSRPASSTSSMESATSRSSATSVNSVRSAGSATFAFRSGGRVSPAPVQKPSRKGRGSRKQPVVRAFEEEEARPFKCTFCCHSFKNKYDWSRHEKSQHLTLEGWVCTPHGSAVLSSDTGRSHCAFCNVLDPTHEHLEKHDYENCRSQGHVFGRKDHLVQHLRLIHGLETLPIIDDWKVEAPTVTSRCGFCDRQLPTWRARVEHLAEHFRRGATMDDWKGEHGFEASIKARVTNAMPPYLIGSESRAIVPFSANDSGTKDHLSQIQKATEQSQMSWQEDNPGAAPNLDPSAEVNEVQALFRGPPGAEVDRSNITFPEVLALHLGRYARQQVRSGVLPTDEMFQQEARRLIYDSKDPWDQTIADNDSWLSTFRSHYVEGQGQWPPS